MCAVSSYPGQFSPSKSLQQNFYWDFVLVVRRPLTDSSSQKFRTILTTIALVVCIQQPQSAPLIQRGKLQLLLTMHLPLAVKISKHFLCEMFYVRTSWQIVARSHQMTGCEFFIQPRLIFPQSHFSIRTLTASRLIEKSSFLINLSHGSI